MPLNLCRSAPVSPRVFLCLAFLIGGAWIGPAQPVNEEATDIALLRAEVQRLALDLLHCRAELIHWKMHSINAELQQVRAERQRLVGERQLIEREIGDLNQAAANGTGADDEARREELNTVQLPAILARERAVTAREATLAAALGAESARMAEIQKQVARLEARAHGHK